MNTNDTGTNQNGINMTDTDSGTYAFTTDLNKQYQILEQSYKDHKAKAREHTAAASDINKKMKALDAEKRRQERRLKDILDV